jgi:hypothetical protein
MPEDSRIGNQGIQSSERIQVAAAKSHHPNLQQDLSWSDHRIGDHFDTCPPWFLKNERFHIRSASRC